ncbi:MAG: xylulokinase [Pleomorphochaeta sp.]
MDNKLITNEIKNGKCSLGIELGSTRIKAILINSENVPIASGGYDWENSLIDNIWTYKLSEVWQGVAGCYSALKKDVLSKYNVVLTDLKAIGFSAMMHGYLAFDKDDNLLVPFRTWRNNITQEASEKLTKEFNFPIPQRWSIAHLYQAILNNESHVKDIAKINTLAGYVHYCLTNSFTLGIGDASGMFPIDSESKDYNKKMLLKFDDLAKDYSWKISEILPNPMVAGEIGGYLSEKGAQLLDVDGDLKSNIPFCPAEGDAGTGMVATNSVKARTGNVSAGTSVFAMIVLEKELSQLYEKLDLVTTPSGLPVAMAHSNNCSGEIDKWMKLFMQVMDLTGGKLTKPQLYDAILFEALKADPSCDGILSYGYLSGEHITGFSEGRPLIVRNPDSELSVGNLIRSELFTSLCALRTGLNILFEDENVKVDEINGHGGFFKTAEVGQNIMSAATNTPCSVLSSAGEGGAWGIAILAGFINSDMLLEDYLEKYVFANATKETIMAKEKDIEGFNKFFKTYHAGLDIERKAIEIL